jgi:hypothetical protein
MEMVGEIISNSDIIMENFKKRLDNLRNWNKVEIRYMEDENDPLMEKIWIVDWNLIEETKNQQKLLEK